MSISQPCIVRPRTEWKALLGTSESGEHGKAGKLKDGAAESRRTGPHKENWSLGAIMLRIVLTNRAVRATLDCVDIPPKGLGT